jgi:hypothetical protein
VIDCAGCRTHYLPTGPIRPGLIIKTWEWRVLKASANCKLIKFKVDSVDVVYIQTLWGKEKKTTKTATDVPGQVPGERTCC